MAINPKNFEKSDQMKWGSDDQNSSQVRSYTCCFCKRGFSNAQALGGHMNIHRRDRARLKLAADENSLPLEITMNPSDHEPQALREKFSFHDEKSSTKKPLSLSIEDDDSSRAVAEEVHQLPLFVETAGGRNEDQKGMQFSHASQPTAEVDLELRLGPEPQETSTVSTREFF